MRSKKAAIEVQFNWLFVLIIGAVILIIFTTIIFKQKKVSENSQDALLLRNVETILSNAETTQGTVTVIPVPETRIEFRCNRYSIGTLSKQVEAFAAFTPSVLEGNRFISMTLDWSLPYRVTNVLYVTAPTYRYVFVGNDPVARELFKMMPNETFSESVGTFSDLKFRGENKVRFIFFDDGMDEGKDIPKDYLGLHDEDVSALKVRGTMQSGEVFFYGKEDEEFKLLGSAPYVKPETLMGAVISDSLTTYTCVMDTLFRKLDVVSAIYIEKTSKLRSAYTNAGHRCASLSSSAYNPNSLNSIISATFDKPGVQRILEAEKQLKAQNKQAQLQSCSTIY